jgi:hypothetical protein
MGCSDNDTGAKAETTTDDEALPEFNPLRQVGWIFRDKGCVAIARRGDPVRSGVLGD